MTYHRTQILLPAVAAIAVWALAARETPVHAAPATPDISGVYWATTYRPLIESVAGESPPYKPEAMAEYKKNIALGSKLDDRARSYCLPEGVPRAIESPYPF